MRELARQAFVVACILAAALIAVLTAGTALALGRIAKPDTLSITGDGERSPHRLVGVARASLSIAEPGSLGSTEGRSGPSEPVAGPLRGAARMFFTKPSSKLVSPEASRA